MARDEAPPFSRGETFYNGGTIDTANLGGAQHEGKEWVFEDIVITGTGAKAQRSNRAVRCRCVRNVSGGALLPKTLARMKTDGTGNEFLGQVMGVADTVGQLGYPVDEFLPAAGVPNNDLFWVVVEGPATVITAGAGDTNIGIGAFVIPSTSGHVVEQDVTVAAGAATFNQIQGAVGRAVNAVNAINTDLLIDVQGQR